MRYIAATDGSDPSEHAVRYAAEHAAALDATLEVVHTLEPDVELVDGDIVFPGDERSTELAQQTLDASEQLATEVAAEHDVTITVETTLLTGRPADAITDHADATGADAIYVGHRGLTEQRENVVGSVAKSVVDKAAVPVTVIR